MTSRSEAVRDEAMSLAQEHIVKKDRTPDEVRTIIAVRFGLSSEDAREIEAAARNHPVTKQMIEQRGGPKRVILVHLYVEASKDDSRTADELGDFIRGAIEVGVEGRDDVPALLSYDVTLCDEIEGPGPAPKTEEVA